MLAVERRTEPLQQGYQELVGVLDLVYRACAPTAAGLDRLAPVKHRALDALERPPHRFILEPLRGLVLDRFEGGAVRRVPILPVVVVLAGDLRRRGRAIDAARCRKCCEKCPLPEMGGRQLTRHVPPYGTSRRPEDFRRSRGYGRRASDARRSRRAEILPSPAAR